MKKTFFLFALSLLSGCAGSGDLAVVQEEEQPAFFEKISLYMRNEDGMEQPTGLVVKKDWDTRYLTGDGYTSFAAVPLRMIISPDQKKVLFNRWENAHMVLYTSNIDGSEQKKIAEQHVPEGSGELDVWTLEWVDSNHVQYSEQGLFCPAGIDCEGPADFVSKRTTYHVDIRAPENKTEQSDHANEASKNEFIIPEAGIKIILPEEYTITKNTEDNRRGSFASYDFRSNAQLPIFQEIQFFSDESITQFTSNCGDATPCFFGDYPDLARYNTQKNAFQMGEGYKNYQFGKFGNRNYLVSNFKCNGDSCIVREYTTFIGDIKIDIWVTMANEMQTAAADDLFEKFEIIGSR